VTIIETLCNRKTEECEFLDDHIIASKRSDEEAIKWFDEVAQQAKDKDQGKPLFHAIITYKNAPGWKTELYADYDFVPFKDFRPDGTLHSAGVLKAFDFDGWMGYHDIGLKMIELGLDGENAEDYCNEWEKNRNEQPEIIEDYRMT
jgi:hypothetical protein